MTLSRRRIVALVSKDFRIHGRDIVMTQLGILALLAGMAYARPDDVDGLATALFGFNLLLAGFWGEWLITREKTKGTFAWIRSCPVDDAELVVAKFLAVGVCSFSLWGTSSVIFLREHLVSSKPAVWLVLQTALLVFALLSTATRFRFGEKVGQMLPFGLAMLLFGGLSLAGRLGYDLALDPETLLRSAVGQVALSVVLIVCCVAIFSATLLWVRRSDTERLLE